MSPERQWCKTAAQAVRTDSDKLTVTSAICKLPGGAQSALVVCSDGVHYILKTNANLQGPNLLANEWLGGHLASALRINVPSFRMLLLKQETIDRFPILGTQRSGAVTVAPLPGIHFGSRLAGAPRGLGRATPYLSSRPGTSVSNTTDFLKITLLDIWANTQDKRETLFVEDPLTHTISVVFIDNGHMFGGPHRDTEAPYCLELRQKSVSEWPEHMIEDAIIEMERVIPDALRESLSTLPSAWYKGSLDSFQSKYMRRLENVRGLLRARTHTFPRLWSQNDRFRVCRIPGSRVGGISAGF